MQQEVIPGKTLLFLDEIQDCPKAIMALRYFKEELPELHVVGAGSLLEFTLNDADFRMPVGRVQFLHLHPLSFAEFLVASGNGRFSDYLKIVSVHEGIEPVFHKKLLDLVREYMVLGGMPEVLTDYFSLGDYRHAQEVQTDIMTTYRNDFGKYAKSSVHKYLQLLFERAPGLIAKWFKYSKVDPEVQSRVLKSALQMLNDAGLIHLVYATLANGLPLISSINYKKFKLLFLDVGLVHRAMRLDAEILMGADLMLINRGALAEQFVGQELLTMMSRREPAQLFFWNREVKSSSAEVDFVFHIDSQIVPIEVKAGATGRLRSLKMFLEEKKCPLGVRISQAELSLEKNILSVPFYLIHEIPRLVRSL